jgi:hypothetical protein
LHGATQEDLAYFGGGPRVADGYSDWFVTGLGSDGSPSRARAAAGGFKILSHLKRGAGPQLTADGFSLQYDVTGEPIPRWAVGVDPAPEQDERGPPSDWDSIDPPASDE